MKAPCGHQLDISKFNELCSYCPCQWSPSPTHLSAFGEQSKQCYILASTWVVEGISTGTHWPKTQTNGTQSHYWEPCLATKDGWFRLHNYYNSSLGLSLYIPGSIHCTVFLQKLHMTPIPAVFPQTLSLYSFPKLQIPLAPVPTCPQ